ncbi:hypothetical protein [Bosea sp. NBC_00550]|uniref:hypothetical protein n=1 Tax=Bosea sp. NBC_00550 TaxID=2969621 RepID=UPI002231FBE8|nr:hypothetical protein [Bosea sp. NBC_00550]UZF90883.1 hypothetical protein NWE53_17275 [Bosea sp. NBC_00550]
MTDKQLSLFNNLDKEDAFLIPLGQPGSLVDELASGPLHIPQAVSDVRIRLTVIVRIAIEEGE